MELIQYDRDILVSVLVYHYRNENSSCGCGWGELGKSHPEHVANVYEESIRARTTKTKLVISILPPTKEDFLKNITKIVIEEEKQGE